MCSRHDGTAGNPTCARLLSIGRPDQEILTIQLPLIWVSNGLCKEDLVAATNGGNTNIVRQ